MIPNTEDVFLAHARMCVEDEGTWGDELEHGAIRTDGETYIRIVTPDGHEAMYWHVDEWTEDPTVLFAIVRHAAADWSYIDAALKED